MEQETWWQPCFSGSAGAPLELLPKLFGFLKNETQKYWQDKLFFFDKSGTWEARAAALWVRNEVRPGSVLWKWFQLHFSVTSSHTDLFSPLLNSGDFQSNHPGDPPWSLSAEILWQNQDQVEADYFWIYFTRPDFVLPTALSTKVL